MTRTFRRWEIAALLALCLTLLLGTWAQGRQQRLAERVIRLHVIAESDGPEDQEMKLQVRDAVLAQLAPALEGLESAQEAAAAVRELLPALAEEAARVSGSRASAALGAESYPTRRYTDFALPAGEYLSLRVTLGAGQGHNWWCVVYPPLCLQSVTALREEDAACLSGDDWRLITEEGESYVIRFRLLELWGDLFFLKEKEEKRTS